MKRKLLCQLMAITIVGTMISGEAISVLPGLKRTAGISTVSAATYSGSYQYVEPNDSVTLSPASVKASDVVDAAVGIISQNEGSYTTVSKNDVGALSVGKLQWHGQSALTLLREIIAQNKSQAKSLLGSTLYNEIMNASTNWNSRILTSTEADHIESLLSTSQSRTIQDKIERSYIASYVNHGISKGLRNAAALVYYADLANQGGTGGAGRVAANAYNLVGSYSKVTLNELHIAGVTDDVLGYWASKGMDFRPRRFRVYGYATGNKWSYCNSGDSIIPYKTLSSSNSTGAAWLQWVLNEYAGASLSVTGKYDSNTSSAVKKFQTSSGLTSDGLAGTNTIDALMEKIVNAGRYYKPGSSSVSNGNNGTVSSDGYPVPERTLKEGSSGNDVKWVQSALNSVEKAGLSVNGKYDTATKNAVISFQKKTGLSVDGIFGTNSRTALEALVEVQASKPTVSLSSSKGVNKVTWKTVSGATMYRVYRKTSATGSWERIAEVKSGTTSFSDTSAKEGTTYYYTVKAFRTDGQIIVYGTYETNKTVLTSNKSESITSYPVPERTLKEGSSGNDVKWVQSALNSVEKAGLSVNGKYDTATKNAVISFQKKTGLSVDGIFGTNSRTALEALVEVQASKPTVSLSSSEGVNKVTWKTVSGATMYRVYRKTSATGSWERIAEVKSGTTSFSDTSAKEGTTYYYTVKAFRTDGQITVYGTYETNKTVLTSDKSESVTSYPVPERTLKEGSSGNDVKWVQSALNSVEKAGLSVNGKYDTATKNAVISFQKKTGLSVDGIFGTNSRTALEALVEVQASKPTVSLSSSEGVNKVTWKTVSGATMYRVYRKTSAAGSWERVAELKGGTTSWSDTSAKEGTTYYYTVKAFRIDGQITIYGTYETDKTVLTTSQSGSSTSYPVPERTLKEGSSGNDVKWLQNSLNIIMHTKLTVNGKYDSATKTAVTDFQKKTGLSADGIFGTNSLTALKNLVNVKNSKPSVSLSTSNGINTIKWSKVSGANRYRVYRRTNTTEAWTTIADISNGNTISFQDKTAQAGTTYYYTVKAFCTDGNITIYGSYYTDKKIQTSQKSDTSSTSYPVPKRTLQEGSSGDDVKWLQASLNTITGAKLTVSGKYDATTKNAVKDFQNKAGLSADGIFGSTSLSKMQSLLAVRSSRPSVTLSTAGGVNTVKWDQVSGATMYRVYRKVKAGDPWVRVAQLNASSATNWEDSSAVAGTTYYYTVKAFCISGQITVYGTYYTDKTIKTSAAEENPDSYTVPTRTLQEGDSGNDVKWLQYSLNSVLQTDLTVNGQYDTVTETAVKDFQNKAGLSADGIFGSGSRNELKTLINVMKTKPQIALSSGSGINKVDWNDVSGATMYKVYRKQNIGDEWEEIENTASDTTVWDDKTVQAGETYYYTVKAVRTLGKITVYSNCYTDKKIQTIQVK